MRNSIPANFDYSKVAGLPEIGLRLDFLRERLDANLADSPSVKVLEIGIGTGDCTMMLASKFAHLTALDRDQKICRAISQALGDAGFPKAKIICDNLEEHSFEGTYHAIILQNILEHIDDPIATLGSLRDVLSPEGRFYINVPLANSLHRLMGVELGMIKKADALSESDIEYGHKRIYTQDLMIDHLRQSGLRPAFEMPYYLKPFSTGMLQDLSREQHVALFNLGRKIPQFASYFYVEASTR